MAQKNYPRSKQRPTNETVTDCHGLKTQTFAVKIFDHKIYPYISNSMELKTKDFIV